MIDSAALYSDPQTRLHHPAELSERLYAFAGPAKDVALHVATGTGQCARRLQDWTVDASEEQVKQCQPHSINVFSKGCAEGTGVPSHRIDLVTVATALHWCAISQK